MAVLRRNLDRRRRVLYSAHQAAHESGRRSSRQETERLREARRPGATYGSRVQHRLRGRWFSLVPVHLRTLLLVATALLGLVGVLTVAHFASVAWPPLAGEPAIARPLRLDQPDSFGRWLMVAMLATATGTSLLIFQLRRHRNDDFAGQYRVWRTVMIVTALASVNTLVSLIDWTGALLDAAIGRRVALTGSDWVRLVVTFGGTILFLQLVNELKRCRSAVAGLTCALIWFAIPQLANWNLLEVSSLKRWTLITSAPLWGCAALFLSLGIYLRVLYREVRKIPVGQSWRERLESWRADREQLAKARAEERQRDRESAKQKQNAEKRHNRKRTDDDVKQSDKKSREEASEKSVAIDSPSEKKKRSWLRWRSSKPKRTDNKPDESASSEDDQDDVPKPRTKKRWFSFRLKPRAGKAKQPTSDKTELRQEAESDADAQHDEAVASTEATAKRGLDWLRRKRRDASAEDASQQSAERDETPQRRPQSAAPPYSDDDDEEDEIDPDDIDWNSLSKAERRRMRKQLKRQRRAA